MKHISFVVLKNYYMMVYYLFQTMKLKIRQKSNKLSALLMDKSIHTMYKHTKSIEFFSMIVKIDYFT